MSCNYCKNTNGLPEIKFPGGTEGSKYVECSLCGAVIEIPSKSGAHISGDILAKAIKNLSAKAKPSGILKAGAIQGGVISTNPVTTHKHPDIKVLHGTVNGVKLFNNYEFSKMGIDGVPIYKRRKIVQKKSSP